MRMLILKETIDHIRIFRFKYLEHILENQNGQYRKST